MSIPQVSTADVSSTRRRRPTGAVTLLALALVSAWSVVGVLLSQQGPSTIVATGDAVHSSNGGENVVAGSSGSDSGAISGSGSSSGAAAGGLKAAELPCAPITKHFSPVRLSMPKITPGARVIPVGRSHNVVGTPPLSSAGKRLVAWDEPHPGVMPGGKRGTAIFTMHTWPDGSALGNKMLRSLQEGSEVRLYDADGTPYCYTVRTRETLGAGANVPGLYAINSPARLVFIVCSGKRIGPGHWTTRDVWWIRPSKLT